MEEKKEKKRFKLGGTFLDNTLFSLITGFLLIFVGQNMGYYAVKAIGSMMPGFGKSDVWISAQVYLMFIGIWITTLVIMVWRRGNRPMLKILGTAMKGNTPRYFAIGLAIGLGMNLLCAFVAMANGDIALTFDNFNPFAFLLMFVSVFIQGAAEELVCRGYLHQKLVKRFGSPIAAVVITAAVFSLLHAGNSGVTWLALLNIFLSGLLFGAMVVYMDSLWAAMAAHAAWNFCQNVLLGLPNSGSVMPYSIFKLDAAAAQDSFAYSVGFGLEGTITACLVLAIATGAIVWWGIRNKKQPVNIWEQSS